MPVPYSQMTCLVCLGMWGGGRGRRSILISPLYILCTSCRHLAACLPLPPASLFLLPAILLPGGSGLFLPQRGGMASMHSMPKPHSPGGRVSVQVLFRVEDGGLQDLEWGHLVCRGWRRRQWQFWKNMHAFPCHHHPPPPWIGLWHGVERSSSQHENIIITSMVFLTYMQPDILPGLK